MWQYLKHYIHYAVLAALLLMVEVFTDLLQPSLMSKIVDDGVLGMAAGQGAALEVLVSTGVIMICAALVGCVAASANNVLSNMCTQGTGNAIRKAEFAKIMSMQPAQVERLGAGSLITRTTNDINQIEMYISVFIRGIIRSGFTMVGAIVFMFRLNAVFGWMTLAIFPVAAVILVVCLRAATPIFARLQALLDQVNSVMQEDLSAIRVIKACVREATEKGRFEKANAQLIATQLKALLIFATLNPAMNCVMYLVVAAVLLVGGYQVQDGQTSPGVIMAGVTYVTQLLGSVMGLVMMSQEISRGQASWKRVRQVLEAPADGVDVAKAAPEQVGQAGETGHLPGSGCPVGCGTAWPGEPDVLQVQRTGQHLAPTVPQKPRDSWTKLQSLPQVEIPAQAENVSPEVVPAVEFCGVGFAYPGAHAAALEGISLSIMPGQTVAIMGSTGAGKTALVNLVARFFDATEGQVRVFGRDVSQWPLEQLRANVSVAAQKVQLFGASVADNILWGRPGATDDEVRAAAKIAQADGFISAMPEGYDSVLGQRGLTLSGGQRQRVALARAVLKDAPILVIDDATSALDLKTEADFYAALAKAKPQLTKIIVAQRIASVRGADMIVLLDEKRIAGVGTHDELLANNALYQEIYASQFGAESEVQNA